MAVQINADGALGLLDLTPMIDMVFNLLIFFMVVTQFASEERDLKVAAARRLRSDAADRQAARRFSSTSTRTAAISSAASEIDRGRAEQLLTQAALNNPASQSVDHPGRQAGRLGLCRHRDAAVQPGGHSRLFGVAGRRAVSDGR